MNKLKYIAVIGGLSVSSLSLMGQEVQQPRYGSNPYSQDSIVTLSTPDHLSQHKAWEIGVGGAMINWSRVSASGFQKTDKGYSYKVLINHVMGGGLIYVARELNPWFYLDFQGSVGLDRDQATNDLNFLYMGGLGLQFRLTPMFKYKYVEPYFRVGINYQYKDFTSTYGGTFLNDPSTENPASWHSRDLWNPNGASSDARSSIPVSVGLGLNSWFTDHLGFGLQGEYLIPIQTDRPKFAQISAKIMWRFGGESHSVPPVVREIIRKQEVVVEKPIEKIVEKKVVVHKNIYDYLKAIYFDFDKDIILPSSTEALDNIAEILKHYPTLHFLVIGHTDARGSVSYNQKLSEARAKAVRKALIDRGIRPDKLKAIGIGKRSALLKSTESNKARRGDRKVEIEFVDNLQYWNAIAQ